MSGVDGDTYWRRRPPRRGWSSGCRPCRRPPASAIGTCQAAATAAASTSLLPNLPRSRLARTGRRVPSSSAAARRNRSPPPSPMAGLPPANQSGTLDVWSTDGPLHHSSTGYLVGPCLGRFQDWTCSPRPYRAGVGAQYIHILLSRGGFPIWARSNTAVELGGGARREPEAPNRRRRRRDLRSSPSYRMLKGHAAAPAASPSPNPRPRYDSLGFSVFDLWSTSVQPWRLQPVFRLLLHDSHAWGRRLPYVFCLVDNKIVCCFLRKSSVE